MFMDILKIIKFKKDTHPSLIVLEAYRAHQADLAKRDLLTINYFIIEQFWKFPSNDGFSYKT